MRKRSVAGVAFAAALLGPALAASGVGHLDGTGYDIAGRCRLKVRAESIGAKIGEDFATVLAFGDLDETAGPDPCTFELADLGIDGDGPGGTADDEDLQGEYEDDARKPDRRAELFYFDDDEADLSALFSARIATALERKTGLVCSADMLVVDFLSTVKSSKDLGKIKGKELFLVAGRVTCAGIGEDAAAFVKKKYAGLRL